MLTVFDEGTNSFFSLSFSLSLSLSLFLSLSFSLSLSLSLSHGLLEWRSFKKGAGRDGFAVLHTTVFDAFFLFFSIHTLPPPPLSFSLFLSFPLFFLFFSFFFFLSLFFIETLEV